MMERVRWDPIVGYGVSPEVRDAAIEADGSVGRGVSVAVPDAPGDAAGYGRSPVLIRTAQSCCMGCRGRKGAMGIPRQRSDQIRSCRRRSALTGDRSAYSVAARK